MGRETWISRTLMGGCYDCTGTTEAHWFGANTQGVAARHHDATGHTTWVDVYMGIRYGADGTIPETTSTSAPLGATSGGSSTGGAG